MSIQFENSEAFAVARDQVDSLRDFRNEFHLPVGSDGDPEVYLVGNSLGLQPRRTADYVQNELAKWQRLGVKGHFCGEHPWMPYHEFLAETMASLVGASASEVVVMNSLTTNLHLMLVTFYRPTAERNKILIEQHAFPSDHYAVESHLRFRGHDPQTSMLLAKPPAGAETLETEDICQLIERHAESLALILLPGVQYYTGQFLDLLAITQVAQRYHVLVGFDLAHAVGNVPLQLHDWHVDFAVWCTYKYLNSGPGSLGGCFIHERHATNTSLDRFAGWWGHDNHSRFEMQHEFHPIPTAEGWQLSNPAILSMAAIRASLDVFDEAGGIAPLRRKSLELTAYLEWLLAEELGEQVEVITPADPQQRGCQLSLRITAQLPGRQVFAALEQSGVVTDWREPNVIRVAPVPLYNSFLDVFRFVRILKGIVRT